MTATALKKPTPAAPVAAPEVVQIVTRVSMSGREAIKALAEAEGITVQQLGLYAWNLALQNYGKPLLPETK